VTFAAFISNLSNRCTIVDSLLKAKAKYDIPDIAVAVPVTLTQTEMLATTNNSIIVIP
jgi:hypothetical protein